jgi:hypothetical protein
MGDVIAAGDVDQVVHAAPASAAGQVAEAARASFVSGFTDAALIVAVLAALTAVLGFAFITNRDLDESALGLPGVPPEYDEPAPVLPPRQPTAAG